MIRHSNVKNRRRVGSKCSEEKIPSKSGTRSRHIEMISRCVVELLKSGVWTADKIQLEEEKGAALLDHWSKEMTAALDGAFLAREIFDINGGPPHADNNGGPPRAAINGGPPHAAINGGPPHADNKDGPCTDTNCGPRTEDLNVVYAPSYPKLTFEMSDALRIKFPTADVLAYWCRVRDDETGQWNTNFGLRQGKEGVGRDVAALAQGLKTKGLAVSGGGHRGAAGVQRHGICTTLTSHSQTIT